MPVKVGDVYGRLSVVSLQRREKKRSYWNCQCSCGKAVVRRSDALYSGTPSCGCFKVERMTQLGHSRRTHGLSKTRTQRAWTNMMARCYCPQSRAYKWYGARGIRVCARWHTFENFVSDMGEAPPGLWLERRDGSKDYAPDNCCWATPKEQNRNSRKNRNLAFNGKTQCVKAWAEELGIPYRTLMSRLVKLKWPIDKALQTTL